MAAETAAVVAVPRLRRTFERRIEATLDVDPVSFATDAEKHAAAMLYALFVGRCHGGVFVEKVTRVLGRGPVALDPEGRPGGGSVDVAFAAEVRPFPAWDVLAGVRVTFAGDLVGGAYADPPRADGGVAARATVVFVRTPLTAGLRVGQLVPARVTASECVARAEGATVYAVPLTCDQAAPVFRLEGRLGGARDAALLAPLLAAADAAAAALAAAAAAAPGRAAFFAALLAPARAPFASEGAAGAVDLVALARRVVEKGEAVDVSGLWARPLAVPRDTPFAVRLPLAAPLPPGWGAPAEGLPVAALGDLLSTVGVFRGAVAEMTALFAGEAAFAANADLWAAMEAARRP